MPSILWTGKLSLPMQILVNVNNLLAIPLGNATNTKAMKLRVKNGYEGKYSSHVTRYDELGLELQKRAAEFQVEGLENTGSLVLDVGCGTGVLALKLFGKGAKKAICGDISYLMLEYGRDKVPAKGSGIHFCQLDGEELPFADGYFDSVVSGMTFGLLPDQRKALKEMIRVIKPGGLVSLGAHGPEHYWEAIDGCFRCIRKRYILGYRLEFWPRNEAYLRRLAASCGLENIQGNRLVWKTQFSSGGAMYDFFAAITASWWYSKLPATEAVRDSERTREYFERNRMNIITDDVISIWGRKPR